MASLPVELLPVQEERGRQHGPERLKERPAARAPRRLPETLCLDELAGADVEEEDSGDGHDERLGGW